MEMEEYKYKGHEITVSCDESVINSKPCWRIIIKKGGKQRIHRASSKPFDTRERAVAEGKTWAEKWIDAREELK